jgi:PPOX class probable F420-dependent enzyme
MAMSAEPLALFEGKRYINLTTFRKSGIAVPTPVWFVVHEGRLYVFTAAQSGKAKRLRANGRALVAPSKEYPLILVNLVLLALAALVAYGRFVAVPL